MKEPSLNDQVEACWLWLLDQRGEHAFWLTPGGRLRHGTREAGAIDVGVFTRVIGLTDFREAVLFAWGELKGAIHGVGHG